jgi:hypothetical protein
MDTSYCWQANYIYSFINFIFTQYFRYSNNDGEI